MNNLNFKPILIASVLNLIAIQTVSSLLVPLLPSDVVTARALQVPIVLILVALITYFVFKNNLLKKMDSTMQGFLSGIISAALFMLIFTVLLSGSVSVAGMVFLIIGSTIDGYLAGK